MTDYLKMMQDKEASTPAAKSNPYLDQMMAEENGKSDAFKSSAAVAVQTNPDEYARAKRVADLLGTTAAAVKAQPDEYHRIADSQVLNEETKDAPKLREKITLDPEFAKLVHDDAGVMSSVETTLSQLGHSGTAGIVDLMGAGAKLIDTVNPFTLSDTDAAVLYKNDDAKLKNLRDNSVTMGLSRFARNQTTAADLIMDDRSAKTKAEFDPLKYATTDTGEAAYLSPVKMVSDAIRSLPTTAALALTAYLTRGASMQVEKQALIEGMSAEAAKKAGVDAAVNMASKFGAGSEGAVGYAQGALGSQSNVEKLSQDKIEKSPTYQALIKQGFNPSAARIYTASQTGEMSGIGAGAVDAATNLVGGKFFGKIIGEGGAFLPRFGKGFANEAAVETIQGGGEQLSANMATAHNIDPNQSLTEGVGEQMVAGLFVGGLTGGAFAGAAGHDSKIKTAQQTEQQTKVIEQLNQLAAASKVNQRDTNTFSDFVKSAAEDGPVQELYISAKEFAQSGVADKIYELSPSIAAQYEQSLTTGTDMRIPIEEYASKIAGTEYSQGLLQHLKTDPDGMSGAEAKGFMDNHAEKLHAEMEQLIEHDSGRDEFMASHDVVKQKILDQMNTVGRFSPAANEMYATLIASHNAVRAAQLNITPEAMFEKQTLGVRGESVMGDSFNQRYDLVSDQVDPELAMFDDHAKRSAEHGLTQQQAEAVMPETMRDDMTGLYSDTELRQAMVRAKKVGGYHYVEFDLFNLGGANKAMGANARTDAVLKQLGSAVAESFEGQIAARRGGGRFAVLVKDGFASEAAIDMAAQKAQAIAKENGLDQIAAPKVPGAKGIALYGAQTKLEGSIDEIITRVQNDTREQMPKGEQNVNRNEAGQTWLAASTGQAARVSRSIGQGNQQEQGKARTGEEGYGRTLERKGSPGVSATTSLIAPDNFALDSHSSKSKQAGLTQQQQDGTKPYTDRDELTGFYTANDVRKSLARALEQVKKSDKAIPVAGLDVSNLSGLTEALGLKTADIVFKNIAHIAAEEVQKIPGADLIPFRNGGDEFLFIAPGATVEQLNDALRSAQQAIQSYIIAVGIQDLPHPKHVGVAEKNGSGIYFGVDQLVNADTDASEYIDKLDAQVEKEKGQPKRMTAGEPIELRGESNGEFNQPARGSFNPETNLISLLKNADLSTFLHEAGHFFFENDIALAGELLNKPGVQPGEQQILDDTHALLKWHGIQGDLTDQLRQWATMDFEEKRTHHERTAEAFEAYLFKGEAPSIELQRVFQTFRAWLLNVYKSLKQFLEGHPEAGKLDDTVRGVFDRMLATTDEIKMAEHARSMQPLFASAQEAGMSREEFEKYHHEGMQGTLDAIQYLQARGLRDMEWLHNAHTKEVNKLKQKSEALRREIRSQVRTEVMSQPVYRAWSWLTGKNTDKVGAYVPPKSSPEHVDETIDGLFAAIAKLGGLSKEQVISTWGTDPADKPASGIFGKSVWRKSGRSLDDIAEALGQYGYLERDENGKVDLHEFEDKFKAELSGDVQRSTAYDYTRDQDVRNGDQVDLSSVHAGRLDLGDLKAMDLPAEVIEKLNTNRMVSPNGINPDVLSEIIPGFTSGDALVRAVAAADAPTDVIENLTDARMLEGHGDLSSPEAISRAADQVIHNRAREKVLLTEANTMAKGLGKQPILAKAAKMFAEASIARLKIRNIKPSLYTGAEVRAAKASAEAHRKGDIAAALAEKRNQVLNTMMARAAYDAKEEVEKGIDYFKKFDKDSSRKSIDPDYTDQIDALLDRFDLRKSTSLKTIDKRKSLAAWLAAKELEGLAPDIPEALQNEANRQSYKEMTVEEFRGLVDSVKQIEHLGRLKNRLLTAKDQRAYEAVRDEMVASINEHADGRTADMRTPTTNTGRAIQGLKTFFAAHIKASTIIRVLDGGKDGGTVWKYLLQPANERSSWETTKRAEATIALTKIMAPVFKQGKMGGKGQYFASIDRSLNREARIAMALNVGNESNMQRLLGGEGWTIEQIMPVLETLTPAEWNAVQQVWDHFESYRPLIAKKERNVYGKEPEWIEHKPFDIKAADGTMVSMRGGYYPVKFDPMASQRAEEHNDAEAAKRQLQGAYTTATTRRSFTKGRVEEVNGRPLLYTLSGLYSGVNEVIHDLAWHEWLIDSNRLLKSQSIDTAIRSQYGPDFKRQLKTWSEAIAEGDGGTAQGVDKALGRLRQGISASGLGFNVVSAAMQITGFNQSIVHVGPKWIGQGIAEYTANPMAAKRKVSEMSEFMENRARTRFRELNELRNKVQDESAAMGAVKGSTYFLMMQMQSVVDVPTWLGAYNKALAQEDNDERAIALADQAVIDSQGGGELKDQSAIERGGPAQKLFTVFYSFMNTAFNLGVTATMTEKSKGKLAAKYLMLYTVPAVLGMMLKQALVPSGDGDDDENLAQKLINAQLDYLMGLMVVVREFGEAAKMVTGTDDKARDYAGPAGLRLISDAGKFAKQVHQGEFDDAFRKTAINLMGDVTGLPSAQVNRTITGANALADGETGNPAALAFGFKR